MKKIVIGLTISAAVLGGFMIAQPLTDSYAATKESKKMITEKEAKEIALQKVNGTITEYDFDRDKLHPHYEVEIQSNNEEVDIEIDAVTGKAIITERKTIPANKPANTATNQTNETASTVQDKNDGNKDGNTASSQQAATKPSAPSQQQSPNTAVNQTNEAATQKSVISKGAAIKIASTVAKGTVTKIELDSDHDVRTKTYELEFKDGQTEYDIEVDAYTGKILEVSQDIGD